MCWPREKNWHAVSLGFLTGQGGGAAPILQQNNTYTGVAAEPWLLGPGPFSPHIPSMGLETLPLSRLHCTCAPLCHYCLSLPSDAPPPMTALWPEPRLPAAAAKSLQSCPTLCNPIDGSPPGSPILGFSRQEYWSWLPFPSPMNESEKWKWSRSVVSDSSWPHGLQPTRLLRPWDFPGKSTGVGCPCLLHILIQSASSV